MTLNDIIIKDDDMFHLKDENGEDVEEPIDDLKGIYVYRKISDMGSDIFHMLLFAVGIVFPPIFLYFIWRWYKAWKTYNNKYLMLAFEGGKGSIKKTGYIADRTFPSSVDEKVAELNDFIERKGLIVKFTEGDSINAD